MLISLDIISTEDISLNFKKKELIVKSYKNIRVLIYIILKINTRI